MNLAQRITDWSIRWRWPLLGLAIVLAAAAYAPSRQLDFDQSIENMFAPDDPVLPPYRRFKEVFGGDEIVLAAYVDDELLTAAGIQRLGDLTTRLRKVAGVAAAQSLADQPLATAVLQPGRGQEVIELFEGYMVGADRRTAAVVCILTPRDQTDAPRERTVDDLRDIIRTMPQGVLAGEPVMLVDGFRYLGQDGRLLSWTSTSLLILVMAICFRSLRWVVVPIAVVQLTLLLTQACLVLTGVRLSMVSSMLSAIVTIVGVATVVHLIVRFRECRQLGLNPTAALQESGGRLAGPIFGACLTDAVGFGSLLLAGVGPIQDFGVMTALGAMLVLVSVPLLVPGLTLMGQQEQEGEHRPAPTWSDRGLDASLLRMLSAVLAHRVVVLTATLLVAAVALAGCLMSEVETDFTKNFRANSPVVESYEFVESRLGGAGVWDIMLPAPAQLTPQYLDQVEQFSERLRREVVLDPSDALASNGQPGLTKVLSLADILEAEVFNPGGSLLRGGFFGDAALSTRLTVMRSQIPQLMSTLYGQDPSGQHFFRIMLRAKERQPSQYKLSIIDQVRRITREEFPTAEVTGFFVLLTNLINSMLNDQWITFGAATAGIALVLLLTYRSVPIMIAALVPNVLPVLLVMGLTGWLGLKTNMGAAMIAAVSMGLSVDSSIHFITAYLRQRQAGLTTHEALASVQRNVGRAMVYSTLALVVGFSALCLSQFVPTIYFGALVSVAMLGGLACNLIGLPVLLTLADRRIN